MKIKVTRSVFKSLKKDPGLRRQFETAAGKAVSNPAMIKKLNDTNYYSLRIYDGKKRVILIEDDKGALIPCFIGTHDEYQRFYERKPSTDGLLRNVVNYSLNVRTETGEPVNFNYISRSLGYKGGSCAEATLVL